MGAGLEGEGGMEVTVNGQGPQSGGHRAVVGSIYLKPLSGGFTGVTAGWLDEKKISV